jgi:L-ascorbate metabolism protein UlaG (beta-lactamase superfamily)
MLLGAEAMTNSADGSITFIGNATLLISYAGFTVLTDPNFVHRHEQVSIGFGMHATRLTDPSMEIADLPELDLVVLSHFHGDHFDQVAERELDRSLPIYTTPQAANELRRRGFTAAYPLETFQSVSIPKAGRSLRITATPGRHGPPVVDLVLPDVMGTVLDFTQADGAPALRVYITGDTLLYDDLNEIPRRYPDIDFAFVHLGGTRVMGILVTMDAEQGVQLVQLVGARTNVPIHYDDYDLFTSPLSDFQAQVRAAGLEQRVRYLAHGDTLQLDLKK